MTFNRTEQALINSLQSLQNGIEQLRSHNAQLRAKTLHNRVVIKLMADHIGLNTKSLNTAADKLILDTTNRVDLENLFNDDK